MALFSIGHSNHSGEGFLALLAQAGIEVLVDVRSHPQSRFHPQFNHAALAALLAAAGIEYRFEGAVLGGKQATSIRDPDFERAMREIVDLAREREVVLMCSEREPERCHRATKLAAWLHRCKPRGGTRPPSDHRADGPMVGSERDASEEPGKPRGGPAARSERDASEEPGKPRGDEQILHLVPLPGGRLARIDARELEARLAPQLLWPELQAHLWVIDGNNVYGSRPDGWWRDRAGAAERLARSVAEWCASQGQRAILVFDGRPRESVVRVAAAAGDPLRISFAGHSGRDAADDRIAELVDQNRAAEALTVVSADRGLVGRLPPGVAVEGPSRFLERLGIGPVRRSRRAR